MRRPTLFVWTVLLLALAVVYGSSPPAFAQEVARYQVQTGTIAPDSAAALEATQVQLSRDQLEALQRRKLELRERTAALWERNVEGPPGPPMARGRETEVQQPYDAQFHGVPGLLIIGRNNLDTNGNNAAKASTLAEPAAANNALDVFAAGNFNHAEFSSDGGTTWADVALPGGPADAPILCCDHDVVIDDARRVTFHSTLYINSTVTNGAVRIFVRPSPPAAACSFTIDPAGTADNILPDFPHLGLTKRFLYLSINAVGAGGGFARMYRFNIDQMSDCLATAFSTFDQSFATFGQRVWRPAEGTNNIEAMYWGQRDNSTTFRIFRWLESGAAPASFARTITATNTADPDCRGGVGNFDFVRAIDTSLAGFSQVGAAAPGGGVGEGKVVFFWPSSADDVHIQGHVHGAAFQLPSLMLFAQPVIFNSEFCFAFPTVTANKRGDLGLSIAFGGVAGGGGSAAQGAVGLDDEFTSGIHFGTLILTASGTHNRSDDRFGDYFTIHPYEPCEKWFTATNYARLNGTAVSNINSRYIEFGRNQSARCYKAHATQRPVLR